MAKREILAGAIDQTVDVFIQDSSSTVGAGLAALVFNSAGLLCYYRKGATGTPTALTLATLAAITTAHADGGFKEADATNMKGVYRLDLSDTIVAAAGMVTIYLYGATNMAPVVLEIEVVSVNKFDAVRMGMTALPNAAAEAAGGLYTRGTGAGQINQAANGQVDTNVTHAAGTAWASGAITAAVFAADAITDAKVAADVTIASVTGAVGSVTGSVGGSVTGSVGSVTGAVGSVTGNVGGNVVGSVGSVTGAVGSVTGNVGGNVSGSVASVAAGGITASSIADGAIDRMAFAADTGLQAIRSSTAQSGASTSITLDAGASSTTDFYVGAWVYLTGGTGVGQTRLVTAYNGTTKVATTTPAWATNPAVDSTFAILPATWLLGAVTTTTNTDMLTQANVRTALGLASANLDTQLDALPTNSELATAITTGLTTALTEGYRGTNATGSVRDLLYECIAHMGEHAIVSTTKTLKKIDGSTTAKTFTLNSATTPSAITEAT